MSGTLNSGRKPLAGNTVVVNMNGTPHDDRHRMQEHGGIVGAAENLDQRLAERTGLVWSQILSHQDYGTLILLVAFAAATGSVHYFPSYAARPVFPYDASISLPMHPDTIAAWIAIVIPIINLLITVIVIEYVAFRKLHSRTIAATALIHFTINAIAAFLCVLFFTELFKRVGGRLRPDYLARCMPSLTGSDIYNAQGQLNLRFGQFSTVDCTSTDGATLADGHMGFPSGHASSSMFFGVYAAIYAAWSMYFRPGTPVVRQLYRKRSGLYRLGHEVASALLWMWVLWQLSFAWGVGVSRFRDNKHEISDVLGGFLLAFTFATVFGFRAIGMYDYFMYDSHNACLKRNHHLPEAERIRAVEMGLHH